MLLKKIPIKTLHFSFLTVKGFIKTIFWFIFSCILLLQTLIVFILINDINNGAETISQALILYSFIIVFFITGLFMRKKSLIYASAISLILLFIYLSSLPDLAVYYNYFDGLD